MELETKLDLKKVVKSKNLAEDLSELDRTKIANLVWDEWFIDQTSRYDWEQKTAEAMKLALQVMEEKSFPWSGASNVKFPLVTIAALQYSARAYPALIPSNKIVQARVVSDDPTGQAQARADRIENYMSFQVLEEDEDWEEEMDKALISQAIVGCAFKKTYFDAVKGHNESEHVLAKDLYIPYFAKSLDSASRITQILYYSKNEILEKQRRELFSDCKFRQPTVSLDDPIMEAEQEAQGVNAPSNDLSAPYELLEQHRYLDLDGDGFEEPYVVTIKKDTKELLRIVARFLSSNVTYSKDKEVIYIKPDQYFTKYSFIPSPDGGIYDLGFGVLLGPLNESINTILNQLVDAGTLSNTAGGFLGRGVKFRSGDNSFRPFEWKRCDSTGDDLRKGVFPLPVREPSNVLFQLLSLLIDYGNRIGMATDPMVGENPGQNTPAETSRNMLQEGQRIFSAIFKRTYRGLKEEFRKLYKLNGIYLNSSHNYYSLITGQNAKVLQQDFWGEGKDVVPAADPNMVSDAQKMQQAQMILSRSDASPFYNKYQVEHNFLQAMKVQNIDAILNKTAPQPQPDPKIIIETMKENQRNKKLQSEMLLKVHALQDQSRLIQAEILEKEAQAALMLAQSQGVETGHQVAAMQTAVSLLKQKHDGILNSLHLLKELSQMSFDNQIASKKLELEKAQAEQPESPVEDVGEDNGSTAGGMAGMENPSSNSGMVQVPNQSQEGSDGGLGTQ